MTIVGTLKIIAEKELLFSSASWVASTGRFSACLEGGLESEPTSEIEPFPAEVIVGRGAIVDACIYEHVLPTKVK